MSVEVISTQTQTEYDSSNNAVLKLSLRVRRKTRADWLDTTKTSKIPAGEACYAIDTGELRIGTYKDPSQQVDTISTSLDNLYYWSELPNVLGVSNEIKLDSTTGNRYLCIDDGDLDS